MASMKKAAKKKPNVTFKDFKPSKNPKGGPTLNPQPLPPLKVKEYYKGY